MAEDPGRPLLIVDAANVVGSVPDGWWRDRAGATERLRDRLAAMADRGLPDGAGPGWQRRLSPPLDIVLVVEGQAGRVSSVAGVRVVPAPGSGDDAITELVRAQAGLRPCVVVTADRELRSRVAELGARTIGPRSVR